MSRVRVSITPSITVQRMANSTRDDHRLEFADFVGKNGTYEVSFWFGQHAVSYGVCALFDYYADICQELYSMREGVDHDIEMSGYPVANVMFAEEDNVSVTVFGADEKGNPMDYHESISKREFIDELWSAKASIEYFVRASR